MGIFSPEARMTSRSLPRHSALGMALAAILLCTTAPAGAPGEEPGEPAAGEDPYDRALELYRAGRFREAGDLLAEFVESGQATAGHLSLLGWALVQQGEHARAVTVLRRSLEASPSNLEAAQALAVALAGSGEGREAIELATRLAEEHPDDEGTRGILRRVLGTAELASDQRLRPVSTAEGDPESIARAGADYLEVLLDGKPHPIFVKGVNMGVALPGRFPAEFPLDADLYRTWFRQIADAGFNVVRTYTLLPPVFYEMLKEHNERVAAERGAGDSPEGRLWLIQGVWTGLPEEDRYDDPDFVGAFTAEMERIVDVLHGNIMVAPRRGHASGLYRHDVSSMTLAFILGREWEPFSVAAYDETKGRSSFSGKYFRTRDSSAMEAWVAAMMEHVVDYEARAYGQMRPVAFTNWPTLDPLHHPTEATKEQERVLAQRYNLPFDSSLVREYDNDGSSVDASLIRATPRARAGHFASYHAYPYYPDFMNLDGGYARARDRHGPNNYVGYLEELRRHHRGLPVLISEIGVPTSRGIAHVQPQGMNHGGHNEIAQGEIDSRLMENIFETGCAGGVIFAWIDEWFKKNWAVIEFELPPERNPKWHNMLDPEQNYGLLALRAGSPGPPVILDGEGGDWKGMTPLITASPDARGGRRAGAGPALSSLWAAHDEAFFYIRVDAPGLDGDDDGEVDWDRHEIQVGIDTYGAEKGDRRFPARDRLTAPTGMEFMVILDGRETSRVLVDPPYDLQTHRYNRPYRSVANEDGRYMEIRVLTNRKRVGRDGTLYPEISVSRSPLRLGTTDPEVQGYDDLSDWSYDADGGIFEVRLPWGLLNVTDPSSHQVVEDGPDIRGGVGTATTGGFRLYAALVERDTGHVRDTLPERDGAGWLDSSVSTLYAWPGWEEPTWHSRLKRSYFIVKQRLAALPDWIEP